VLYFFKKIVKAKINDKNLDLKWYKDNFINAKDLTIEESSINAGINKKTITNIYGSATKKIVLDVANSNFEYLSNFISNLEDDNKSGLNILIKISYNSVNVDLTLTESLLVINTLATRKIALRGGAWSSIGKQVEKPLVDKLCELCGVPKNNIDNKNFKQDKSKSFDREVDYKLISKDGKFYRVEIKLMGRGNPESADVIIARDTDIFIADTLSKQNKSQLESLNVKFLEMKNNNDCIGCFKKILKELNIPIKEIN
jgi:hypothetical protein